LQQIAQLQHNDSLLDEEYQKLKGRYEREYEKKLQELNKSKQEIKKGYLGFIDNFKDLRH
jgi:predicted nuclease with TOPRIM domain